jgi:glycine cleavage system H protein
MSIPADLKYTAHDEWIRVEGDEIVVGITHFAQDQLGELVHVELPEVGASVAAGDPVAEVESVKAVAEIYAPAGGEVTAVNEALADAAEAINDDPYGSWIFRLKLSDAAELDALLDAAAYTAKIGG